MTEPQDLQGVHRGQKSLRELKEAQGSSRELKGALENSFLAPLASEKNDSLNRESNRPQGILHRTRSAWLGEAKSA